MKIRLTESKLKQIVAESVKRILSEKYDDNGFNDKSKVHKNTRTAFNPEGYDWEGYDKEGYNKDGWRRDGINKFTKSKYDKAGYDRDGFNKFGLDKESEGNYRFIENYKKWSYFKNFLSNIDYDDEEGLGAYNNENLLNIPDLAYWLNYSTDRFAAVTKNGDVYTDYDPNLSVGNIFTDTLYSCMDNGKNENRLIGEVAVMFKDIKGMYTLITKYDGVFKGRVKRYNKRLHIFLIEKCIA